MQSDKQMWQIEKQNKTKQKNVFMTGSTEIDRDSCDVFGADIQSFRLIWDSLCVCLSVDNRDGVRLFFFVWFACGLTHSVQAL